MPGISHITGQLRKVSKNDIHSFMTSFRRTASLWSNHKANLTAFHQTKWSNRQWTRSRRTLAILLDSAQHLGLFNDEQLQVKSSPPYPVNSRNTLNQRSVDETYYSWQGVSQHMLRARQFLDQPFWREQCYRWAFVRACSAKGSPGRSYSCRRHRRWPVKGFPSYQNSVRWDKVSWLNKE